MKVECHNPKCLNVIDVGKDGIVPIHYPSAKVTYSPSKLCPSSNTRYYELEFVNLIFCPQCGTEDATYTKASKTITPHFKEDGSQCSLSGHSYDNQCADFNFQKNRTNMGFSERYGIDR